MISSIRADHTSDSFDHQFRKVKARAKELRDKAKKGEIGTPVKKSRGKSSAATPASETPKSGTKRRKIFY